MTYTKDDLVETAVGCFSSVLLFLAVRGGETMPFINAKVGFIMTLLWFWLLYKGYGDKKHFVVDVFVVLILCSILTTAFGLVDWDALNLSNFFGSPIIIAMWLSLPMALLFDKYNVKSVFKKYYLR